MSKFLKMYHFPNWWKKKIEYLNNPLLVKIIQNLRLFHKENSDSFIVRFHHTFKEEIISITTQSISENREKGKTSKLILRAQYYSDIKTRHGSHYILTGIRQDNCSHHQKHEILRNTFNKRCIIPLYLEN